MNKFISILFVWSYLSATALTDLRGSIDSIITSVDPNVHVGIEVISMKTREVLYKKNTDQLFIPASTLKLFTAAAATSILGVDYRFETKLYRDEGGSLYLQGSGDPSLSQDDLRKMIRDLKIQGSFDVQNVFVDNFVFDPFWQGPGWMWDEPPDFWNSPSDGLTVDHSSISFYVTPAKQEGLPPSIVVDPPISVPLDVEAVTGTQNTFKVDRLSNPFSVRVTGELPLKFPLQRYRIPVLHPALYTGEVLKYLLQEAGIAVRGSVILLKTPASAQLLVTHRSETLSQLLYPMMKSSDNMYADTFFKRIGATFLNAPGSWQKGSMAVREFLRREVALDPSDLIILDGSGLSRYDLLSPHNFSHLLGWLYRDFKFSDEVISSLPISGVDGTLKNRMQSIASRVRAKTGSMMGISGLVGYVVTRDNEVLSLVILQNGFVGPSEPYKCQIEDAICKKLALFTRKS
ncbi:MAG: D-alanyl-D-alanine carboxypeptidase/D-alanyl-D-alanine-endopeptidase [Verrucomicrobia bacterium]|nr:D-alanyl-D-alanine carboxypeptidase/D-alanyl-D-alanine-endopeptidase [Verrucomicrobiota bacterium]